MHSFFSSDSSSLESAFLWSQCDRSLIIDQLSAFVEIACTDTYVTNLLLVSNSGAICTVSFVMLMFSYAIILHSLRNHSAEGKKKALYTCISHIIVVIFFFGPCIFTWISPPCECWGDMRPENMWSAALAFTWVLTPLIPSIIYL